MKLTLKDAVDALNRPIPIQHEISSKNMLTKEITYNPVTQKYQVIRTDLRKNMRKIFDSPDLVKAIDKYNSIIIKESPYEETKQETPTTMPGGEVQPESNSEEGNG